MYYIKKNLLNGFSLDHPWNIKGITERTNTKIDIEDGGIVTIASHDGAAAEEAQKIIEGLTRKVHEGEIFSGVVTRII